VAPLIDRLGRLIHPARRLRWITREQPTGTATNLVDARIAARAVVGAAAVAHAPRAERVEVSIVAGRDDVEPPRERVVVEDAGAAAEEDSREGVVGRCRDRVVVDLEAAYAAAAAARVRAVGREEARRLVEAEHDTPAVEDVDRAGADRRVV